MDAFVFPGQGSQFQGMGKDLADQHPEAANLFAQANEILGFSLTDIMFAGSADDLRQTRVTQPAIFVHSMAIRTVLGNDFSPQMVAGHSLGEFSALTATGALSFDDGLRLVAQRAQAMQDACNQSQGTMAAVLALADEVVEEVCVNADGIVVAANYNCPGQLVISGEVPAVEAACEQLKEKGAKRALLLPVGGAFHSPLMEPAREQLADAIRQTSFIKPSCPIYQNVTAQATQDIDNIKDNLIAQLTGPVRWTQSITAMRKDGATQFVECGPGKVLQGLVRKIDNEVHVQAALG
ncbi:MAG: [acyl-carrier-protein] S-malonyltransferase [Flavobacteriaceae bacterium]|nr:[acyl-carrier-protein] S-malonyltransferase [Flavobacteriaceae bacterium]|tara:strand:+ start:11211 stop:12092 length:882 start_codon:yes stop_codon:yes gene_type:complete